MTHTRYELLFQRPLPDAYVEYRSCLGCGGPVDDEGSDCECPCGIGFGVRRKDGSSMADEERKTLYKQPPLPATQEDQHGK